MVTGSCERGRRPVQPPSKERRSLVLRVDCCSIAAARLADFCQVGKKGGAGCRPSLPSRRTSWAARLRRSMRYVKKHCFVRHGLCRVDGPPDFAAKPAGSPNDRFGVFATSVRTSAVCRRPTSLDPDTAVIVQPTDPGPPVVSVDGRVHAAVGPAGLGN